jgi:hypothetical protein
VGVLELRLGAMKLTRPRFGIQQHPLPGHDLGQVLIPLYLSFLICKMESYQAFFRGWVARNRQSWCMLEMVIVTSQEGMARKPVNDP